MKDVVLNEVKKISKKYNRSEKFVILLTKICLNFKIYNYEETIEKFFKCQ